MALGLAGLVAGCGAESPERVRRLAFHPSGRYLYTSGDGGGLRIFRVDSDGSLQETAREMQGGGEIVLTVPPS